MTRYKQLLVICIGALLKIKLMLIIKKCKTDQVFTHHSYLQKSNTKYIFFSCTNQLAIPRLADLKYDKETESTNTSTFIKKKKINK